MGRIESLEEGLVVVSQVLPQIHVPGTLNGTGIDTRSYDEALIVLHAGTADATGVANVKVQDSADNSTFADITGAVFAEITTANDNTIYVGRVRTKAYRRYLRVVSVVTTDDVLLSACVILGKYDGLSPVTQTESFAV